MGMDKLQILKEITDKMVRTLEEILQDNASEIQRNAPILIYQRFCHELVTSAKSNVGKTLSEVPEYSDIMAALRVLEKCYPELLEMDGR